MLDWMHDDSVVHDLRTNFLEKTLDDCISFINHAREDSHNLHLAIVDDNDTYMGTVSLKNIVNNTAEFGITVRRCAMGKGFSFYGMKKIIEYGLHELDLSCIYWCVDPENKRALRFYDKHGYRRCDAPEYAGSYTKEEHKRYIWYIVNKNTNQMGELQ